MALEGLGAAANQKHAAVLNDNRADADEGVEGNSRSMGPFMFKVIAGCSTRVTRRLRLCGRGRPHDSRRGRRRYSVSEGGSNANPSTATIIK